MDINLRNLSSARPTSAPAPRGGSSNSASSSTASTTASREGVTVQLTGASAALQSSQAALQDVPAVDSARVASLKDAISSGRYTVNAERVAAKFVSLEGML